MAIDRILKELDNLIEDSTHIWFTNKVLLEEDDLTALIMELQEKLPNSIEESKQIVADRQRILDSANKEAHRIIEQARAQAAKMIEESAIVRQAQDHGTVIVNQAQKEAELLRNDSFNYACDVFGKLSGQLEDALNIIRKGHTELSQASKK